MFDPDKILVVDNLFPQWLQDNLDTQLFHYSGWQISSVLNSFVTVEGEHPLETYCTKLLFHKMDNEWDEFNGVTRLITAACADGIKRAIPDVKIKECIRVRLNGTFKNLPLMVHLDSTTDAYGVWSIVYFLNDSDGGTSFYYDDGSTLAKTVPFKKGSAVIFPSCFYHHAEMPVEHTVRITAGAMFVIDTELNKNVFVNEKLLPT